MAEAVRRRPLTDDVGFIHRPVCIGFVMDEVVRTQDLVRVLRFLPVSTIKLVFHAFYIPPTLSYQVTAHSIKVTHPATHPYADPYSSS